MKHPHNALGRRGPPQGGRNREELGAGHRAAELTRAHCGKLFLL